MSRSYPKYTKYQQPKKESIFQRFRQFLKDAKRILKIANKPSRKEYFMVFKIVLIGMFILGLLSYVIQLIASVVSPFGK